MTRIKYLTILFMAVLASACAGIPDSNIHTNVISTSYAPVPGADLVNSQATLSVANVNATGTATVIDLATSQAYNSTAVALYSAQATSTAAAEYNAGLVAMAGATAVSVQAEATKQALYLEGTRQALAIVADATATAGAFSATVQAQDRVATAEAQLAANMVATAEADSARLQLELQRQATFNAWLPFLYGFVLIIALLLAGAGVWYLITRDRNLTLTVQHEDRQITLVRNQGGYHMLPVTARHALPAPQPQPDPIISPPTIHLPSTPPPWSTFMNWHDPRRCLVGVSASGRPLSIDRDKEPHLFIAGTTGAGKTRGGLLPFAANMLGAGVAGVFVNGRGNDFRSLRKAEHPNILVAPDVDRESRPAYLAGVLQSLVAEVDRRDQALRYHNVDSWRDITDPTESGELLIVIDEFLAIVETAKDIDKDIAQSMWYSLKAITNEARKFGVFVLLTATDPTERALGRHGFTVINQCARLVFGMKNAAASQSVLALPRGSNYPQGSVGLPVGSFLSNIGGMVERGQAFHPTHGEIVHYIDDRNPAPVVLPPAVVEAVNVVPAAPGVPLLDDPQVIQNARDLDHGIDSVNSLRAVVRYLNDLAPDASVNGGAIDRIAKPALQWRVENMNCEKAAALLARAS